MKGSTSLNRQMVLHYLCRRYCQLLDVYKLGLDTTVLWAGFDVI